MHKTVVGVIPKQMGMDVLAIADISIGSRNRKDFGDLQALADSIKAEGLLQPIGVTPEGALVFGERRVRACQDILGWTEIDVRVVNVTSIVAGEFAENEIRKDFTPSERVAIAVAVREEIVRRQGARTDLGQKIGRSSDRPMDEAAQRAGFGNRETARQASNVVRLGVPKLVKAMDSGEVSISTAEAIAREAPADQEAILKLEEPARITEMRRRKEEAARIRASADEHERNTGPTAYTGFLRKNGRLPTAEEARTIARLDMRETPSADGKRHSPEPPTTKEQRAEKKRIEGYGDELWRVRQAVQYLTMNESDPALMIQHGSFIDKEVIAENLRKARIFFNRFAREWRRHGK